MLSRHKLRSHVGVSFPCQLCSFKTSRAGKLKQHRLVAHPDASVQGEHQQELGDSSYRTNPGSDHHLGDVKPGEKTFFANILCIHLQSFGSGSIKTRIEMATLDPDQYLEFGSGFRTVTITPEKGKTNLRFQIEKRTGHFSEGQMVFT